MSMMMKTAFGAVSLMAATISCQAATEVKGESFDVLAAVMASTKKEINAKDVLTSNKEEAIRFRDKITAGWWEFMQANSKARPGEYCAATFLRAKRVPRPGGVDLFEKGTAVTLFGPGGSYRGALLGFSPLSDDIAFPKLQNGQKVLVTLKQGNEAPTTLNAIYMRVTPSAPPLIVFTVPSIEALMDGMEDTWSFDVVHEGQSIASIEWRDGLKARDELKRCLAGQPFDNKSHIRD
ncbi:MAG: hypothetical protein HGA75_02995 [Thiobacillus sp.]|nr:hypothetical protein [Thiobacillus sp.]